MRPSNIKILLRQTEDWRNKQLSPMHPVYSEETARKFIAGVHKWNETYDLSYFEFRARLKDIAMQTWPKVDIVGPQAANDENTLYLVTDDDDWYAPNIIERIMAHYQGQTLFVWRHTALFAADNKTFIDDWTARQVGSNSYALRGKAQNMPFLIHGHSSLPKDLSLDEVLSLYIRHPASHYRLVNREAPPVIERPGRLDIPESLQWARPAIGDFFTLLNDTYNSRKVNLAA